MFAEEFGSQSLKWIAVLLITLIDLTDNILKLSVEELEYMPKVILLKKFGHYVEHLWEKLPEHVRVNSEVWGYQARTTKLRCKKHYNQSWQQTHIDGLVPYIKDWDLGKH